MSALDAAFAALADPTRRGVIRLLMKEPRRAGELATALDVRASALTRHLRILRDTGFVAEEHSGDDGRVRVYTLRQGPLVELRAWIDEVEGFWTKQLASFQRHVERGARRPGPRR